VCRLARRGGGLQAPRVLLAHSKEILCVQPHTVLAMGFSRARCHLLLLRRREPADARWEELCTARTLVQHAARLWSPAHCRSMLESPQHDSPRRAPHAESFHGLLPTSTRYKQSPLPPTPLPPPPPQKVSKEWRAMALKECDPAIKAYWVCRQEAGMSVFYACRGENEGMKTCISSRTGDEAAFGAYRQQRLATLAPAYYAHKERVLQAKLKHYTQLDGGSGSGGGAVR